MTYFFLLFFHEKIIYQLHMNYRKETEDICFVLCVSLLADMFFSPDPRTDMAEDVHGFW